MNKTLIRSEKEYREFAFRILEANDGEHVEEALGAHMKQDCWHFNEQGQPIDEQGNVIPDETPDTLILTDEIKELVYPVVVVHVFDKDRDRQGCFEVCLVEFVSLADFHHET